MRRLPFFNSSTSMSLILPGENPDHFFDDIPSDNLALGPNIYQSPSDEPRSQIAGILQLRRKTAHSTPIAFVDTNNKRYIPELRDLVVGVIVAKISNGYRVMLQENSPPVFLDAFAFESATKKTKPNLALGSLVYAKVTLADPDIEANIECYDSSSGKSAGFGELKAGYVINVGSGYARALCKGKHPILQAIGEKSPYEVAIGVNGKIWIDAPDSRTLHKISECLIEAEKEKPERSNQLVNRIFKA